jgi:subtilisin family serine protease
MKRILCLAALLGSTTALADSVITFKPGVHSIPSDVQATLLGSRYEVKRAWTAPMFTVQSLPRTPWERARRQPSLALLVYGSSLERGWNSPDIGSIEENIPYAEEETLTAEPPFDPVRCDGIIYAFEQASKADQKLETAASCDNFALRVNGDAPYKITLKSTTPKTMEVYEHGDLLATGSGELKVQFHYGYRQKYITVRGEPGPFHIEIAPVNSDPKKEPLNNWILSDLFSNAYGYGVPDATQIPGLSPSEPSTPSKYVGANMMGADVLWEKGFTGKGIKVAVIDSGVDSNHPFLKDAVVGGYNVYNKSTSPDDYQDVLGHGSHVAGIIHQVAPDAEILSVRIFEDDSGGATLDAVTAGIQWAINNGANVVNMSLGGGDSPKAWPDMFKRGIAKGIVFVAASGNERASMPLTPAAYAGTIPGFGLSVGAADALMNMAVFSNWTGDNLNMKQVTSHGKRVLSVAAGTTKYTYMSGTSMASPQMAGYMALLKQAHPKKSNAELVELATKYVRRASVND